MCIRIVQEYFCNRKDDGVIKPLLEAVTQGDTGSVRLFLEQLKVRAATDTLSLFDYMFFSAYFFNNMLDKGVRGDFSSRDYTPEDAASVEELLKLFEKYEEASRFTGIYDHLHYLESWKDLIWSYLAYVQYNDLYDGSLEAVSKDDAIVNYNDCTIWFHNIIAGRGRRLIELMKRHDSLVIEMVPLHPDPRQLGDVGIFNGTRSIVDRMLLNMSFPGKFGYFLSRYSIKPSCSKPSASAADGRNKEVFPLERVIREFPDYEHIVRINHAIWRYNIKGGEGDFRRLIDDLRPFYEILCSGRRLENHREHESDINMKVLFSFLRAHADGGDYSGAEKILNQCQNFDWCDVKGLQWTHSAYKAICEQKSKGENDIF
ncbi:MAG: hypothetical protein AB9903_25610 [Vulcanimicrobiota bacterium]